MLTIFLMKLLFIFLRTLYIIFFTYFRKDHRLLTFGIISLRIIILFLLIIMILIIIITILIFIDLLFRITLIFIMSDYFRAFISFLFIVKFLILFVGSIQLRRV